MTLHYTTNLLKRAACVLTVFSGIFASGSAQGAVVFELDTLINGTFPTKVNNALPALKATFADTAVDEVTLTLDATNLLSQEFVDNWVFNSILNAASFTVGLPLPPQVSSIIFSNVQDLNGGNNMKAGLFNMDIGFNTAGNEDRFNGGETVELVMTLAGLDSTNFLKFSIADGNVPGGWYTAAHIQGIPATGGDTTSGSIGTNTSSNPVPEPTSLALASLGVLALVRTTKRRRERAK